MPAKSIQRTMRLLEKWQWPYWIVERHNIYSGRKTDLFHIIDILALTPASVVGVQSCGSDFKSHVRKIMEDEQFYTKQWLQTKNTRLIIIGWRPLMMKGTLQRKKYYPRIAEIKYKKKKGLLAIDEKALVKGEILPI